MTHWQVLVNPRAGRRAITEELLGQTLADAGVSSTIRVVDGVPALRRSVVEAAGSEDGVALAGGDGTVSIAVDALLDAGVRPAQPIGILPVGTGCDLLRTFGRGTDLVEAARRLRSGSGYPIDVGYLDGDWGRRHFVNVAQAGVGAAAVESAGKLPRLLGPARYPAAFAVRLPGFPRAAVRISGHRWDPEPVSALAVIVANGQFFAGGWNIAPKAMLGDGALDVQLIAVPKSSAPRLVPKLIKGLHLHEPGIRRRPTAAIELETDPVWPIEADGDLVGSTPVRIGVLPRAIEIQV